MVTGLIVMVTGHVAGGRFTDTKSMGLGCRINSHSKVNQFFLPCLSFDLLQTLAIQI